MSAFTAGIYAKNLTDRFGFGVTLDAYGAITLVSGPEICRVTADPNGNTTAHSGSLALQQNGASSALWVNTSAANGTTWVAVGGTAVTNFLDNVVETFGTVSPLQVQQVYVSASNRFDLRGVAVSQATLQDSVAIRIATGADEITGAVNPGGASGQIEILSGATNANNAGAVAGASGAISIKTGASTLTAGLSGNSGALLLSTGNSTSGNSGNVTVQTGTAGGVRGSVVINSATVDYSTQAIQHTVFDNNANAYAIGATGALSMLTFDTTNTAERIVLAAKNGMVAVDNVPFTVGTAPANQFSFSYFTATTTGFLAGADVTAGGASNATRTLSIQSGTRVLTDAAGSPGTGVVTLTSGPSNVNFAGGGATGGSSGGLIIASGSTDVLVGANTGGPSGGLTIGSGSCGSTAGTSGSSGDVTIQTGNSDDANSGSVKIQPGSAGGTRGTVQAIGRLSTTDGVTAGTARIVGGQANENPAASVALANVLAAFTTGTYSLPANTLKVNTVIRFEAIIGVTAISGGGCTAQVEVFLNGVAGTLVFDTTALAAPSVAANSYFVLTGRLACRASGAGGTMVGVMTYTLGAVNAAAGTTSSDIAGSVAGTYTVAVNTTIGNTLDIGAVTDAAGTTLVLEDFHIYMEA